MSKAFRELAKLRNDPVEEPYGLQCVAHDCPMKWSVEPGHLCSYHAWSDSKEWPAITESLLRDGPWELDRKPEVERYRFAGDYRAWARRIVENPSMSTQASLQMAKDALGIS